jgi:hypothetical protein
MLPTGQLLCECGVTMGSVLKVVSDRISFTVLLMKGHSPWLQCEKNIDLRKRMDTKIINIKETIEKMISIPVAQQRLTYAGRELDDSKTLREEGAKNKWSLNLVRCSKDGPSQ